jgi:hypothetical protein
MLIFYYYIDLISKFFFYFLIRLVMEKNPRNKGVKAIRYLSILILKKKQNLKKKFYQIKKIFNHKLKSI